jgi:hypothetical protein
VNVLLLYGCTQICCLITIFLGLIVSSATKEIIASEVITDRS